MVWPFSNLRSARNAPLIEHTYRSLILHEIKPGDDRKTGTETKDANPTHTLLHLRFRGKIAATGLKRRLLVWGGGVLDHITTAPMLAGLAERAEFNWKDRVSWTHAAVVT